MLYITEPFHSYSHTLALSCIPTRELVFPHKLSCLILGILNDVMLFLTVMKGHVFLELHQTLHRKHVVQLTLFLWHFKHTCRKVNMAQGMSGERQILSSLFSVKFQLFSARFLNTISSILMIAIIGLYYHLYPFPPQKHTSIANKVKSTF